MQEATTDPAIIISGGSVTIEFDDTQLQGGKGRHHHPGKKIKLIEVKGGDIDINQPVNDPNITIKIFYGD